MAFLNERTNELHLKILLAGSTSAGKTTNLQSIYKQTSPEVSTRMFDLHALAKTSTFFEFLPLSYGEFQIHPLRLHLYTLPAHSMWESVQNNLASGTDGIIFVTDSRIQYLADSEKQLLKLNKLLQNNGRNLTEMPVVFQYNHRDSSQAIPLKALKSQFSLPSAGEIESVAVQDVGVLETLDALMERVLYKLQPGCQSNSSLSSGVN